jgi:hypothetical protein
MNVEESIVLLSDEIYGCKKGLAMPVPQLQMSLKSTDAFMGESRSILSRMKLKSGVELSIDATPTYVAYSDDLESTYTRGSAPLAQSQEAVFIEGEC